MIEQIFGLYGAGSRDNARRPFDVDERKSVSVILH